MRNLWRIPPEKSVTDHRTPFTFGIHLAVVAISTLIAAQVVSAQPKADKPVVEERTLKTDDNFELKISYFKSKSGKDAPVVIMLHGKQGTRLQWVGLAKDLQNKEFAVVTVDLRGHGESPLPKKGDLKKSDYQAMVALDMDAVRDFIFEEHQSGNLNINKMGIVACDFSASVAISYAQLDWEKQPYDDSPNPDQRTPRGQDVQALALISPDINAPGLFASKSVGFLRTLPIHIMIGASEKAGGDMAAAKKLNDQFILKREKTDDIHFEKYRENFKGMDLVLKDATVRRDIMTFLNLYVMKHQSQWRDRRSREDRE